MTKTHLLLDLDGTLIRRQIVEKSFFPYSREKDVQFHPVPEIVDTFGKDPMVIYLRPGLREFLSWAVSVFEGRVYLFTASDPNWANRLWGQIRKLYPEVPNLRIFGGDECIWEYRRESENSSFYGNDLCKNLTVLINKHEDLFPDLDNDRWLLVDDRFDLLGDDFTREVSIIVPAYSPAIKVSSPSQPDQTTVFVSDLYFANPISTDWEKITKHASHDEQERVFFDGLTRKIMEKLPLLAPLPNPVVKEIDIARSQIRYAQNNGASYIFSCSAHGSVEIFWSEQAALVWIDRHEVKQTYALVQVTDESDIMVVATKRARKTNKPLS